MTMDITALRTSFALVVERSPDLAHGFYVILFARYPQVQPLFSRSARDKQEKMLTQALVAVMDHLEDAPWLETQLMALGARHAEYGVADEMYAWVGECLVAALKAVAGDDWTPRIEQAWTDAFAAISGLMLAGAMRERGGLKASA
jgi:hemoglobin-like flavoprotein